ncbi:MAG: SDR family NAD(P)-dependent oxidoreductase [Verrucomicrobiia bacterium]
MMRFQGKVAVVTGSGRGIGRAAAELLAAEGAAVVVNGRTRVEVEETARAIRANGGKALAVVADLAQPDAAEELVGAAEREFGAVDILVNNAALSRQHDFVRDSQSDWMQVLEVNLLGAVRCARAAAVRMVKAGRGGRIVNVSSVHGFLAEGQSSHYDVAKGGLDQLTRTLAVELAPYGILVNGVSPGFVDTAMSRADGVNELETDTFREIYVKRRKIPLARAAQPEEIARVILFLAGPDCSYMTGECVVVDGGLSITF